MAAWLIITLAKVTVSAQVIRYPLSDAWICASGCHSAGGKYAEKLPPLCKMRCMTMII